MCGTPDHEKWIGFPDQIFILQACFLYRTNVLLNSHVLHSFCDEEWNINILFLLLRNCKWEFLLVTYYYMVSDLQPQTIDCSINISDYDQCS